MSEYNVMGTKEKLKEMMEKFPLLTVIEKFSPTDWNVRLPNDPKYEDEFIDWCEADDQYNVVEAKFVG